MFKGTYTALVTPFNKDGSVDYGALRALVDAQAAAGVAGVCPVGTTGESPTLSYEEHEEVIRKTIEYNAGRMQVIAGTGANCTREAVELTQHALADGADATLQIAPYYNKPSPEGLYRHFMEVADVGLPVLLYNAPGRTSRHTKKIVAPCGTCGGIGKVECPACEGRGGTICKKCSGEGYVPRKERK